MSTAAELLALQVQKLSLAYINGSCVTCNCSAADTTLAGYCAQSNIKKDPDGYKDEFLLQYRHYQALLEIFKLKPSKDSREFGEVVMFMAQVGETAPHLTAPCRLASDGHEDAAGAVAHGRGLGGVGAARARMGVPARGEVMVAPAGVS